MAGKQPCVAYHSVEKLPVTSLSFATLGRQEILLAGVVADLCYEMNW